MLRGVDKMECNFDFFESHLCIKKACFPEKEEMIFLLTEEK